MYKTAVLAAALICLPVASYASDAVDKGTIEVAGATSLLIQKQTLTPKDDHGNAVGDDESMTSGTVGVALAYYVTRMVGVGATVNYQKLDFFHNKISGGAFGGLVRIRVPISPKADFVVSGAGGLTQAKVNPNEGGLDSSGHFWLAGGTIALVVNDFASIDVGVNYSNSTFAGKDTGSGTVESKGVQAALGFSLYFTR